MLKINTKRIITAMVSAIFFSSLLAMGLSFRSSAEGDGASVVPAVQAQAKDKNDRPGRCSERTVRGTYAFALTGNVIGVGPFAASGTTTFDGEGNFSITGTINTTTLDPVLEGTFTGPYSVNPADCTATATVTTPGIFGYTDLHFKAVIVDRGEEIRYLITNPGIVFAGATVKQ